MQYDTDDLVNSIKIRGMLPDASSGSWSPASLLDFATEELHITLVPLILSAREKFYETYIDYPLTANTATYAIPTRAIGGIATSVQYILDPQVTELPVRSPNELARTDTQQRPQGYYLQNWNVVIMPTPSTTQGTVRIRYFQRPSRLEQTTNCAQITAISGNTVTVTGKPTAWNTGIIVDFVPQAIPFTPYVMDAYGTISGNNISVPSVPSTAKVGDWIALAQYTPIPEVPFEFFPVLAQAAVVKALEANGDQIGQATAAAKLQVYLQAALKMISPRIQYTHQKINSQWNKW